MKNCSAEDVFKTLEKQEMFAGLNFNEHVQSKKNLCYKIIEFIK